uniref:Uncharacterized protein n=1 Tax=Candidatus Kentrum sp. LFY TaxID=2126342 RepID=A0A450U855_9GAMM|nr:MAG: hypothetical protein BECKLFY1418B_GA0070995_100916 [Candidatus Kentron sp. LFY]VFJ91074.1 MAG: hypothetical protein BECKLFY1418A_GA0070994_101423 [Candidatus Kentron sp. LFY]VFK19399.1 MAG: hypothetical protein BECKLFY1418C_GA0070996_105718 [Candidatus Kentron sp. LFY]
MTYVSPSFIDHLRQEKLRQQDRRAAYIRVKFSFIIVLFSFTALLHRFSSTNVAESNQFGIGHINAFLYLIPIVAILFDLYILGGEFAVNRIRSFLQKHDLTGSSEELWGKFVSEKPKQFTNMNRFIVTTTIFSATILMAFINLLINSDYVTWLDWSIFLAWLVVMMFLDYRLFEIERRIMKF